MATYNDTGVVLRTYRLGEADRIITLLTHDHGKRRGVAKGVRRTSSAIGARLEPFAYVDLQITETRSLDIFTSVVTRQLYGKAFLDDYPRFTAAEVMVELADKLVDEEDTPAVQQYRLLVGALRALADGTTDGPRPPTVVLDSYMLRAAAIAGYTPALDACALCGAPGPHGSFHPPSGGVVCVRDRQAGSAMVDPDTLAYLGALLSGDWPATRDVPTARITEASGLVAAFLNWHLERGVRSLGHLDQSGVTRLATERGQTRFQQSAGSAPLTLGLERGVD